MTTQCVKISMSFTVEQLAEKAGVSLGYLNRQISGQHVLEFAKHCSIYQLIGPQLGLEEQELSDIEDDYKKAELKRRAVLERWKKKKTFEATYRRFLEALIKCDWNNNAYQACCTLAKEEGGVVCHVAEISWCVHSIQLPRELEPPIVLVVMGIGQMELLR